MIVLDKEDASRSGWAAQQGPRPWIRTNLLKPSRHPALIPKNFLSESGGLYKLIYILAHCYNKNKFIYRGQPIDLA